MGRVLFAICRTIHSQPNKLTTPLTTEQGNWALVEEGLIEPEFKARAQAQALLFFANVIAGCQKLSVEFFEHQRRSAAVAVVQVLVDVDVDVGVNVGIGVNLDVVLFLDSRRRRLD